MLTGEQDDKFLDSFITTIGVDFVSALLFALSIVSLAFTSTPDMPRRKFGSWKWTARQ